MKISGSGQIQNKSVKKTKAKSGAGGKAFAAELSPESGSTGTAATVGGAAPLAPLNSLLSIQEVPDSTQGPSKGLQRADDMLDLLEEVRRGLLLGAIPAARLKVLAGLTRAQRENAEDPKLVEILEEIELRAEVELAKLGF